VDLALTSLFGMSPDKKPSESSGKGEKHMAKKKVELKKRLAISSTKVNEQLEALAALVNGKKSPR